MKNKKRLFLFIIIFVILIVVFKSIKRDFSIDYKLNNYSIKEVFNSNDNYYEYVISKGKLKYSFNINNIKYSDKKLIKDIKSSKRNNVVCILPIYKKDIKLDMYCSVDENQVSNYYLYSNNNDEFNYILDSFSKYNIQYDFLETKSVNYENLKIYKKNIKDNVYVVWNYKGIYVINKDDFKYYKVLNYDLYDNIMATVTDKYYVLFENTSVKGIKNVYYFDFVKNKLNIYKIEDVELSKNSYINGVINEDIYVTDLNSKKQYIINVSKKSIEEISVNNKYVVYLNGVEKEYSKSDFFMENRYFIKESISNGITHKIYNNSNYYLNGNFFNVENDNGNILLFKLDDITEWNIYKDNILLVSNDTLYLYNNEFGLKKILESNELKYNYKDICKMWKK